MPDDETKVEQFSSTSRSVGGKIDRGVENGLLHDDPVGYRGSESEFARGSEDAEDLYSKGFLQHRR